MTHLEGTKRTERAKRDPKGTRDRLVRAALDLFTSKGYHASTTPQIAARAGIAEGTIYRHFQSKEHLLNEIYRAAVRLLAKPLHDVLGDTPCAERLAKVAHEWCSIARTTPALVTIVFGDDAALHLDSQSCESYSELRKALEEIVAAGKGAGDVRAGSVDVLTDVWLALVVLALKRSAKQDDNSHSAAVEQVLDSAWLAIRAQ